MGNWGNYLFLSDVKTNGDTSRPLPMKIDKKDDQPQLDG